MMDKLVNNNYLKHLKKCLVIQIKILIIMEKVLKVHIIQVMEVIKILDKGFQNNYVYT